MHRAKNKLVLQNGVVWNQMLLLGVSEVRMHMIQVQTTVDSHCLQHSFL